MVQVLLTVRPAIDRFKTRPSKPEHGECHEQLENVLAWGAAPHQDRNCTSPQRIYYFFLRLNMLVAGIGEAPTEGTRMSSVLVG